MDDGGFARARKEISMDEPDRTKVSREVSSRLVHGAAPCAPCTYERKRIPAGTCSGFFVAGYVAFASPPSRKSFRAPAVHSSDGCEGFVRLINFYSEVEV